MDYTQLKNAILKFEEMLKAYNDETAEREWLEQEAVQDSLVKRFEYTLEMAWKSCKRHLDEEGFAEAKTGSPKSIMRLAFEAGVVRDASDWIKYINARQDTSHDYSEDKAEHVLNVVDDFYDDVVGLYQVISGETWE